MPDSTVIGDVSLTIQSVLHDALVSLDPQFIVDVSDLQGNISTTPQHLTIFLFEVVEDPSAKNRPPLREVDAQNHAFLRKTPIALLLRYMFTPWSGDRITDQRIVGKVIETLYDNANLAGAQLQGGLAGTDSVLNVNMAPITLEDRTRVWYSVQKPYRLSLTYEVRVVKLDSTSRRRVTPVTTRTIAPQSPEGT
jgi:Pvc16 N-terminal domain